MKKTAFWGFWKYTIIACLTSLLLVLAFRPFGLYYLAWIAFIPYFYALSKTDEIKKRILISLITGFLFYNFTLIYLYSVYGVLGFLFMLFLALYWGIFGFLSKYMPMTLWPLLWFSLEYLRAEIIPFKTGFAAIGYSQIFNNIIIQSASIVGVYGITLLIVAVNIFVFLFIKKRKIRYIGYMALLVFFVFMWGRYRLNEKGEADISVCAVQSESFKIDTLYRFSLKSLSQKPHFIVWPEYQVLILPGARKEKMVTLRNIAASLNAYLIVGISEFKGTGTEEAIAENYALLFGPRGRIIGKHRKIHLVPIIESHMKRGMLTETFDTLDGRVAMPICHDIDFQDVVRRFVNEGAEFFIVPAMLPQFWGDLIKEKHRDIAIFRAVESDRWMLRATSSGVTHIVDFRGRETEVMEKNKDGILLGKIGRRSAKTFFHRIGWLLPYLNYIFLILFLIFQKKEKGYN